MEQSAKRITRENSSLYPLFVHHKQEEFVHNPLHQQHMGVFSIHFHCFLRTRDQSVSKFNSWKVFCPPRKNIEINCRLTSSQTLIQRSRLNRRKETWKEDLQDIEQKLNGFLPASSRKCSKVAKFAGQKENVSQGRLCVRRRNGKDQRRAHTKRNTFQELAQKSRKFRLAADDLEEDIRTLQAGEDKRGSCACQSNRC